MREFVKFVKSIKSTRAKVDKIHKIRKIEIFYSTDHNRQFKTRMAFQ